MIEIINAITDLIHTLKYGYVINGRRNFVKLMSTSRKLNEIECSQLKKLILDELSRLKINFYSTGTPSYVFFEVRTHYVRVFVLNNEGHYLCRLEDKDVDLLPYLKNSYMNI